jgi:hypothetical protein
MFNWMQRGKFYATHQRVNALRQARAWFCSDERNAEKCALRCMRSMVVGFFLRRWREKFSSYKEPVVRLKNLHHAPVIFIGETDSEFNDHIA